MGSSVKNNTVKFAFVALVTLVSINLWSFKAVDGGIFQILEILVLAGLTLVAVTNSRILFKRDIFFKNNVHLFLWIPLLSVFGAYIYHDQPFNLSLLLLRTNFYWLLYFTLHAFEISKKQVIQLLLAVGGVWMFLTIAQQFTYPTYYFYSRGEDNQSIYRAGVYRYMLSGRQYGLFFLLYFFYKYLTTSKIKNLLFVFCGLAGFYYYGTRQFALGAAACMLVAVLLLRGAAKWKYLLLLTVVIMLALPFIDLLFGSYIEMTNRQLEYDDDIRLRAANFFLYDYWPHWGAKILGNGRPHEAVAYGREMDYINNVLRYFRSDVGIIGAYNQFGIFYVLNIIFFNIKGLRVKFLSKEDKYLKLFFYSSLFVLITNQSYATESGIPFFCLTLYLLDISILEQKRNKANLRVVDEEIRKMASVQIQ